MNMPVDFDLLQPARPFFRQENSEEVKFLFSDQLHATFNSQQQAIWLRMNPHPRPCFNIDLLIDLHSYTDMLDQSKGVIGRQQDVVNLKYAILASAVPGVFNLGGDLNLFVELIENQDAVGLSNYGYACVNVLYRNHVGYDQSLMTISLVQGECLGGGFEAALSSDLIVAEQQARFGFPEILFNLFPGMGAYSFLVRKVGQNITEQLLSNGKIYTAEEMHKLGIVDLLVETGQGERAIDEWIKKRQRNHKGLAAIAKARRLAQRLNYEELKQIVEIWVESALNLTQRDLKLIHRLIKRQSEISQILAA